MDSTCIEGNKFEEYALFIYFRSVPKMGIYIIISAGVGPTRFFSPQLWMTCEIHCSLLFCLGG